MKIGLVGYQGSGKSTLFEWLTGEAADPSLAHSGQMAMAAVPDERIERLCEIYQPKKVTRASLEIQDTPGLSRDQEGNAARLAMLREAGCLVCVVPQFTGAEAEPELSAFQEDLMLADMEIVAGRIERMEEKKGKPLPKPEQEQLAFELETLRKVLEAMEAGTPLREDQLTPDEQKVTRAFRLLSEKPRMILVNTADDETDLEKYEALSTEGMPVRAVSLSLQQELDAMDAEEREAFIEEMGIPTTDHDSIVRAIMEASGQMLFFTAGDKEVRSWMIPKGSTAQEAAGEIHTDMARGFIRAEAMTCSDLFRLGSEREMKAQNLVRREPKDYIVQDDDLLLFHFSV
jgi:hypothetical protein